MRRQSRAGACPPPCILIFALALVPGAAARGAILPQLSAHCAYGGVVRPGHVVPIEVTVENPGVSMRATLVATPSHGAFRVERPIDLPAGTRKRVMLYLDPGPYGSDFKVDLLSVAYLPIATASAEGTPIEEPRRFCVMVGNETWGLTAFSKDERHPLSLANIKPEEAPDRWYGWDEVDVVAWPESVGAPRSVEQERALETWVRMGGTLVLSTGGDGRAFGHLASLLPASVTAGAAVRRDALIEGLGAFPTGRPPADEGLVPVSQLEPRGAARVVWSARVDDRVRPLVVEGSLGMGRVVALAFDPSVAGLAKSDAGAGLFTQILPIPEVAEDVRKMGYGYGWDQAVQAAEGFVADIPPLRPISLRFLLLFMTAYVLVVGPIDYFVLKKLNRMTLTWITYPVAIVVFSAIAYGFASSMKGGEMLVTTLDVNDASAGGGTLRRTAITGLYAVERATYPLSAENDSALLSWLHEPSGGGMSLASAVRHDDGARAGLDLYINIFSLSKVLTREAVPASGVPMLVTLGRPWPAAEGWRDVRVKNVSFGTVHGVMVVGPGGEYLRLGDLAPGDERGVNDVRGLPLRSADTINAGLSGGRPSWQVKRATPSGAISSVSDTTAAAFALGVTVPAKTPQWRGAVSRSLDLSSRLERGSFVVLGYTLGSEPSHLRVHEKQRRSQALHVWRILIDDAQRQSRSASEAGDTT